MRRASAGTKKPAAALRPEANPGRFFVPAAEQWEQIERAAREHAARRRLVPPLTLPELGAEADALLASRGLAGRYREFVMVQISNETWRDTVASIPPARRTLLLPPCLRHSERCRAAFDQFGLLCRRCGACAIGRLWKQAEAMGYAVLAAEGTSLVEALIREGSMDGVIGVSCMPSLERTFGHLAARGVPALAVPLLREGCRDTEVVENLVRRLILMTPDGSPEVFQDLSALRDAVRSWFQRERLAPLLGTGDSEPERIALDWAAGPGKRWRPFLTAAVFCALRGENASGIPARVRRAAAGLECLHKASLIFDDIQDGDATRYGAPALHAAHGVPLALTVGLYLVGQGYRLLAECGAPAGQAGEILRVVSRGHRDLALGQGAEQTRGGNGAPPSVAEVLEIFRLKTAPAFEAVLRVGALLGGGTGEESAVLGPYSEALGVGYQIRDDIEDFRGQGDADEMRSGRPSILVSLAYESAGARVKGRIAEAWRARDEAGAARLRELAGALEAERKAAAMLEECKGRAMGALRGLPRRGLKVLLHRVVARMFD